MKTLTKLANLKTYTPVLNTVLVENDVAYATDCDMLVMHPVNQPDGVYSGAGLKVGQWIKTEYTPTDWPNMEPQSDFLCDMREVNTTVDDLEWVSRAMSDSEARYYLRGIYFDAETMAACDGHALHVIGKPIYSGNGVIIPAMAIEYALMAAKECKADNLVIRLGKTRAHIIVGDYQIITKLVDGTFPDYRRVIPDHGNETPFNGAEITKAAKEAIKLAMATKDKTRKVVLNGGKMSASYGDIQGQWFVNTVLPNAMGFNANYLADIGLDGVLSYGDAASPVKVNSGNKAAVLMPMRV